MALPTLLVDSGSGSDTQASGAGPTTALFGTTDASTDGAGTTVTLTAGTDLSGVATDGSHVIFLNDSTAGKRNFGKITGKAGSGGATPTVTVADAFALSASGLSWAIGGKRASIGSTTSVKLLENNSANGDAMPGWIVELQSGHSETIASTINLRRAGDTTSGDIKLRGASGAATLPLLTFSNNGTAFGIPAGGWDIRQFELRNSNGTKTLSIAFGFTTASLNKFYGMKISHASNFFKTAFNSSTGGINALIDSCTIGYLTNAVVGATGSGTFVRLVNNLFLSTTGAAISITNSSITVDAFDNIFAYCNAGISVSANQLRYCRGNVFHACSGDAITIAGTSALTPYIENNQFTFNAYDIDLSGAGMNDLLLQGAFIRNNGHYGATSGPIFPTTITREENSSTADPSSGSASLTKDYAGTTGGTNFMSSVNKGLGYPTGGTLAVGTTSNSYNYKDIGLQHQDAGGGGGINRNSNFTGGFQRTG